MFFPEHVIATFKDEGLRLAITFPVLLFSLLIIGGFKVFPLIRANSGFKSLIVLVTWSAFYTGLVLLNLIHLYVGTTAFSQGEVRWGDFLVCVVIGGIFLFAMASATIEDGGRKSRYAKKMEAARMGAIIIYVLIFIVFVSKIDGGVLWELLVRWG